LEEEQLIEFSFGCLVKLGKNKTLARAEYQENYLNSIIHHYNSISETSSNQAGFLLTCLVSNPIWAKGISESNFN